MTTSFPTKPVLLLVGLATVLLHVAHPCDALAVKRMQQVTKRYHAAHHEKLMKDLMTALLETPKYKKLLGRYFLPVDVSTIVRRSRVGRAQATDPKDSRLLTQKEASLVKHPLEYQSIIKTPYVFKGRNGGDVPFRLELAFLFAEGKGRGSPRSFLKLRRGPALSFAARDFRYEVYDDQMLEGGFTLKNAAQLESERQASLERMADGLGRLYEAAINNWSFEEMRENGVL